MGNERERRHAKRIVVGLIASIVGPAAVGAATTSTARAWSYESVVSDGCHERITAEALRRARAELGLPTIEPTGEERVLIGELPFDVPADMRDLSGATLLVGVRHNDLKGHGPRAVDELAFIHGNPESQDEHCLRRADQDGPEGAEAALAECRDYIRAGALRAVEAGVNDQTHLPDPDERTAIRVHLSFAGDVNPALPIAYVYLGQALHTLQDSFTHTYRTEDGMRITAVLNWIDFVEHEHDERRDGPAHAAALDQCDDLDDFRQERLEQAVEASTQLLIAALDPAVPPQERGPAIDAVLDEWLVFEPGCGVDNRWCDAPERQYVLEHGCSAAGAPGGGRSAPLPLALALLPVALLAIRRLRPSRGALRRAGLFAALAATLWAGSGTAQAQQPALRRAIPATLEDPAPPETRPFAVHLAVGGSIDNGAVAVSLGARYRLAEAWLLGLDAELNPWLSIDTQRLEWGTFQGYATLIRRYEISPTVSLRTTGQVGVSTLLFDVYGVDERSLGLYVGLSLVGLQIDIDDRLAVVLDPAHVAMPVPQLTGAPFAYRQYRFTSALQWTI